MSGKTFSFPKLLAAKTGDKGAIGNGGANGINYSGHGIAAVETVYTGDTFVQQYWKTSMSKGSVIFILVCNTIVLENGYIFTIYTCVFSPPS